MISEGGSEGCYRIEVWWAIYFLMERSRGLLTPIAIVRIVHCDRIIAQYIAISGIHCDATVSACKFQVLRDVGCFCFFQKTMIVGLGFGCILGS